MRDLHACASALRFIAIQIARGEGDTRDAYLSADFPARLTEIAADVDAHARTAHVRDRRKAGWP